MTPMQLLILFLTAGFGAWAGTRLALWQRGLPAAVGCGCCPGCSCGSGCRCGPGARCCPGCTCNRSG